MSVTSRSAVLFERAQKVMPGGCSRNTILRKPHPIYAADASGCVLTDIEGKRYIDFANNVASLIHGHTHPEIVQTVQAQLQRGSAYTVGTEIEVEFAEDMVARSASFEKIRFVNSGTEAVMGCIKAARAFTGRPKIAKVEGAYHGLYDYAEVSQTANPTNWGDADQPASVPVSHGTPAAALNDVVVIPFNDPETAIRILDQHADELAAVMIDLLPHRIGVIPATEAFVKALSNWTKKNTALLIVDEVITFRTNFDGAQGSYGVLPDLTALGKMIGGGFPVGAITGRHDVMDVMNPLNGPAKFPHYGTFSANPITLSAGQVAMRLFDRPAVAALNKLADGLRASLAEAIKVADVPACVTGAGSMFRLHMKPCAPTSYRDVLPTVVEKSCLDGLLAHLFDSGFLMIETGAGLLSTPMTQADIDQLTQAALEGFRKIRPQLLQLK